jgi:hypothetical protein
MFVAEHGNVEKIKAAYRETADLLVRLRELADQYGPAYLLGPNIVAAVDANLAVLPEASLLIFRDDARDVAWHKVHAPKLRADRVRMLERAVAARLDTADLTGSGGIQ